MFTTGTIARMPHQLGFCRASATAIQTMMTITMLTIGIANKIIHHNGFLATCNIKMAFAIGTQASQGLAVFVLTAMVCSANAMYI